MNMDAGLESGLMAMKVTINIIRLWTKTCANIDVAYFLQQVFNKLYFSCCQFLL
jgi:hypothetical protein